MKQTLKFEIELDANNLPLNIEMHASDDAANEKDLGRITSDVHYLSGKENRNN